ncbi:MAG: T9SS type A sorting domain-containing protein [Bacteroidales bacterium]|jgi:photosystem II stability/assembly factor-like uncharacterized protein|nr:T9SS type A sorting domain-containing protein [Bacteroidales bacterium]
MKIFYLSFIQKNTLLLSILICLGQNFYVKAQPNSYFFCGNGFSSSPWTCLGQHPTASDKLELGIVQSIAIHPSNLNTIYVGGGRFGGLWKTTNGGASWVNKTDNLGVAALGISAIAIHPNNQNIVLAGTQTRAYAWDYYEQGIGVIKSVDGGNTWLCTNLASFPKREKNINVIRFHPTDPNIVLAAGNVFIYKSINAGTSWSIVDSISYQRVSASGPGFIDIEFLPNNPNIVLASTDRRGALSVCSSALLFLSTNAGNTWIDVTPSDAYQSGQWGATAIAIDVTPADPNNFYIMYQNAYSPAKVCIKKSTNGTSWTQVAQFNHSAINFMANWGSWNKFEFEVSNTNLNTFYTGGGTMHRSVDGGNTWTRISEYYAGDLGAVPPHTTHADIRALVQLPSISGDFLIMGDDGGISKTTNGGNIWWNITGNGLVISENYAVGTFKSNNNLVVGLQDNGTKLYNANTNSWLRVTGGYGDGGWTEANYANDNIVYATSNSAITRSTNGGNSFSTILNKGTGWSTWDKFEIDPTDHNKLWVPENTNSVLKLYNASTNTWTDRYSFPTTEKISTIRVAPSNGNVVYVAMRNIIWSSSPPVNKVFKSINGGVTFMDISASCTPYSWDGYIKEFCIDPYNSDRIWAGCGMYSTSNRVIYSSNGGNSWTDISTGLPPFPVSYLTYREGSDDEIYAGTEGGVYRWNKALQKWECFNNGFPPAFVTKLEINNCNNTIVASTFGRGVWKASLSPLPVSTYTVSSTQTWDENSVKSFASDIVISSGVTLTVKGVVKMAHKRRITIKPGGKLIVDGGKITNSCPDKLWNGILVSGNINLSQTSQNQGTIELVNGAIIENSRNAISTGDYLPNGSYDWNSHGGIIYANNATFKNNQRAIEFMLYPPSGSSPVAQNVSYFTNCNFIVDNNNMFANDNAVFANHFTMWAVSGVKMKGCKFENNMTNVSDRGKAIYTENAGYTVDEFCSSYSIQYPCPTCLIPISSEFKGFESAIKSYNSTKQYAITVDRSKFENNIIGVQLEGKNSFQLSRLDMSFSPILGRLLTGIYLDQCTDYKVEANKIENYRISSSKGISGIWVNRPGADENKIYRNTIKNSEYGIKVTDMALSQQPVQQIQRGFPTTGLQFICNDLSYDNLNDIYVTGGEIRYLQGSSSTGADNYFSQSATNNYNFYLYPQHPTPIIYYHFPGMEPLNKTNNVALLATTNENECTNTLCNNSIIIIRKDRADDKSLQSYLEEYRELNRKYDEMMLYFYAKDYDKVLSDYFSGIIENEELLIEANTYLESILKITEYMAGMSNAALFYLKTDSIIDLNQIRDWYDEINTLNAKYSLAETYEQLGKFDEGLKTLDLIPIIFELSENEMIEHYNYVSLFTFKNNIRENGRTIAQLNEDEIEQMLFFAKASRGLSSVMAHGVLCFFYNICLEIMSEEGEMPAKWLNGENGNKNSLFIQNSKIEDITIYPNPTTSELIITSGELKIDKIEVFDIVGKIVSSNHFINTSSLQKINVSNLNSGIYFVKITTNAGEVIKKIIKNNCF